MLSGLNVEVSWGGGVWWFVVLDSPLVVHVQMKGRKQKRLRFSTEQNANAFLRFSFYVHSKK